MPAKPLPKTIKVEALVVVSVDSSGRLWTDIAETNNAHKLSKRVKKEFEEDYCDMYDGVTQMTWIEATAPVPSLPKIEKRRARVTATRKPRKRV